MFFRTKGRLYPFQLFYISRTANIEQSINFYIDEHAYHSECYFVKGHWTKTNSWVLILNPDAVEWEFKMDLEMEKFAKTCRRHGRIPMKPISCEKKRWFIWWLSVKTTFAIQFNNLQYFSTYTYRALSAQFTRWHHLLRDTLRSFIPKKGERCLHWSVQSPNS